MSNPTIEAKISLPANLLEATDKAVNQGKAKSRDEFIMRAICRELAALKRAEIDEALAEMTSDPEYQAEVLQMEAEFATASWEAFKLAESQE
ncbi:MULTISPECIES: CopG family transcriptional regulator [unclassified Microcoleus]|uniref:CopG family transcriptional regulator n=1 Tax=Microcoleus TaxID=44471 RepID=UPI0025CDDCB3|nr:MULTISPECIES: CopG family transcriptional regulator [unclassified Microcoleus]TAG95828.1 MAG: CopG family transcriptional regulator [Oscillatoriales cyanobacterium]TAH23401.1 MAG: CopG family transcriptional regulator [Oscillatoriales cyanobacterium]